MVCSSCDRNRADLHPRKSRLITSMTLLLCDECIKAKREPRFVIILYGRANGFDSVAQYIAAHRYVGKDILASELAVKKR